MGMFDAVSRCERVNAADNARVSAFRRELEDLLVGRAPEQSFDEMFARDEQATALRRKIEIAEGVAKDSATRLDAARIEADKKDALAKNAAKDREAAAAMKRVRAIPDLMAKLTEELTWLRDHVADIDSYNRDERGDLPFIADAEKRVRQRPGKFFPAITENRRVWVDAEGKHYADNLRWDQQMHKHVEAGRTQRDVVDTIRAEQQLPPDMPTRLADAVVLVGLDGNQIWPPR